MISFTKVVEIDEEGVFEDLKCYLFDQTVSSHSEDYCIANLPEDTQRLIFAKIGAMMIDYSKSENFKINT